MTRASRSPSAPSARSGNNCTVAAAGPGVASPRIGPTDGTRSTASRRLRSARRPSTMSRRSMFSGHTGLHAPHKVQASIDSARSAAVAPCCNALARPCGVKRISWVWRQTGQTSRHRLQPMQAKGSGRDMAEGMVRLNGFSGPEGARAPRRRSPDRRRRVRRSRHDSVSSPDRPCASAPGAGRPPSHRVHGAYSPSSCRRIGSNSPRVRCRCRKSRS